jgi:hypothetical protein
MLPQTEPLQAVETLYTSFTGSALVPFMNEVQVCPSNRYIPAPVEEPEAPQTTPLASTVTLENWLEFGPFGMCAVQAESRVRMPP